MQRNCQQNVECLTRNRCSNVTKDALFASALGFFPENNADVNDEHSERFHQDIKIVEDRYQEMLGLL